MSIGDVLGLDLGREYGPDSRVNVRSDGMVSWAPVIPWKTYCQVNLRLFPYDKQTCSVLFVSTVYNGGILFDTHQNAVTFFESFAASLVISAHSLA